MGATSDTLKVEHDLCIMSFSAGGISAGEIYRLKIWNARSSNDKLHHSFCQLFGKEGISSGINNPLSAARPLRMTYSKESCLSLAISFVSICICIDEGWI